MDKALNMYSIELQRNASRKIIVWEFFGVLQAKEENKFIEEDQVFCKLCLDEQKKEDETTIFSW